VTGDRPPPRPDDGDDTPTDRTGGPPSAQDGAPTPPSEFLTPVHAYETIEPDPETAWPATGAAPSPPTSRRRGTGIGVAVVVVVLVAAGLAWIVGDRSSTAPIGAPQDLVGTGRVCAPPECEGVEASVSLSWSPPVGDLDAYRILRARHVVETVSSDVTSYTMSGLHVDRSYLVGVQTVAGGHTGRAISIEVRTPEPPIGEAQLTGGYRVRETVRSAANLAGVEGIHNPRPGSSTVNTWSFTALCDDQEGACATRWFAFGPLRNRGTRYDGSFRGRPATCAQGGRTPTTIEMHLEVTSGTVVAGRWRADRFEGTMRVGFTCPGGGRSTGTLRVEGRFASSA
jgi:hypothetical protein